jgi:Iap family predicted aminopeptidase
MIRKSLFTFFTISVLAVANYAQATQPVRDIFSTKDALEASVKLAPCENEKRTEAVVKLLESVGVPSADIAIEKYDKDKIQNVVVRKKGSTAETVIVGAHYDKVSAGCGVTDNWTGVAILAHLYKTLSKFDTKKSYIFVAFDREEEGLKGSGQMVKAMTDEQRTAACAMVNFDSFGQGLPMALANASSSKMLKLGETIAAENSFKFNTPTIPGASSDSASFISRKIPAITISGLGGNSMEIMHSGGDKIDKVKMDSVYAGYRFGVTYLAKVEAAACGEYK